MILSDMDVLLVLKHTNPNIYDSKRKTKEESTETRKNGCLENKTPSINKETKTRG